MHRPTNVHKTSESQEVQRKTLIHSKRENYDSDQDDYIGGNRFQNSHFDLHNVESNLAHLAQIHLVLEHMLMIRSTLDLENGKTMNYSRLQSRKLIHNQFCSLHIIFG